MSIKVGNTDYVSAIEIYLLVDEISNPCCGYPISCAMLMNKSSKYHTK